MRKWILVGILSLLVLSLVPMTAQAATTDTIQITATGAEVNISVDIASWAIGYVYEDTTYTSEVDLSAGGYFTLTNNGGEAVDVAIYGFDMEDDSDTDTWDLDDTGANGADIFAIKAGNNDGDDTYDTVVKEYGSTPYNQLMDEIAASGTQDFGLQFEAPETMSTYEAMVMVGTSGTITDDDRGVTLSGSVD